MQIQNLKSNIFQGNEIASATAKTLIVFLHGLGSNGDDLISLAPHFQQLLQGEIAYLSPHAPEPFDMMPFGGAYQWFSLQGYDPANRDFDKHLAEWNESVQKPQPQLADFLSEQQARFNIGSEQTVLIGFSQGAMVSLYASLTQRVGAVISYSGALLGEDKFTDAEGLPPYLLLHGEADDVVPVEASKRAHKFLQEIKADSMLYTYDSLPHSINEEGIIAGANFLKKHIAIS